MNRLSPEPNDNTPKATRILLPDGSQATESLPDNLRQEERKSEDQEYVPVIIKRTDETKRHPDDALQHAIEEGLEQLQRPTLSLFMSVVAAGLIVGFSAMAVAVVLSAMAETEVSAMVRRIATAFVYPLGFIATALAGNLLGGSCFVALLNYAHIRRTNE